ncbi:VWA domain-containing protein [Acidisoma cellulosilytica]|uniref:VWA domain-containing protein n=1 Tax=Acidisoma cellulosilyticum TaxID=2802395 RepID=A0A963Z6Q0_9PROT|nr:VWA domain-containing protein [Acidisoma cellulosilyticum]MCB8883825.1 VWA domain-containing protein [Acidisoma cellulosilyticum]
MSFEQLPFVPPELVENPEPRCPCVLLLDTSGSMNGRPITELNSGLRTFKQELTSDAMAAQRVEVAIVTFGPVRVLSEFQSADVFQPPELTTTGDTPLGAAIMQALDLLDQRKAVYKAAGIAYYRPWVLLVTDGAPTDAYLAAAERVHQGDNNERKSFSFFAVGVEGADMSKLAQICSPHRTPVKLQGLSFREMFSWLSNSLGGVARSQPGTMVALPPPSGWSAV